MGYNAEYDIIADVIGTRNQELLPPLSASGPKGWGRQVFFVESNARGPYTDY